MSRTLNLAEGLLSMGRTQQGLGRVRDAVSILSRLSRLHELPAGVAEETQARLGEMHLQRKKFTRARRHLVVALRYDPENAHYHRLLARTLSECEDHWPRAATHYRRALELDPEDIGGLTGFGLLCIKMGLADEGVTHLKKAVELKPDDAEVLALLVKGYRLSGRLSEARDIVRIAMFRHGRDRRFLQLWNDLQFRLLRRKQLREQKRQQPAQDGPVLLPFLRPVRENVVPSRPVTERTAEPVTMLSWSVWPRRVVDQRNVQ